MKSKPKTSGIETPKAQSSASNAMGYWLYLKLRAFAFERLGGKISRDLTPEQILMLKAPLDPTPAEFFARGLLLAISAIRAWTKPKPPPDGSEPIEPLSAEETRNLETQAAEAALSLAAYLPEAHAQELRALAAELAPHFCAGHASTSRA